ncbi:hypothetical protein L596_021486 [Steinernema carpocapsae]|uniref:Uncharacterized protein n=1 Tax=Steinernema carpocapsae TaxID=34508 RepID=A0A4U5MIV1_STECR|nr:hypothetical protein L596_021486 [Steinernema carpocapsae]
MNPCKKHLILTSTLQLCRRKHVNARCKRSKQWLARSKEMFKELKIADMLCKLTSSLRNAPYAFCHDVCSYLPQLRDQSLSQLSQLTGDWLAAAKVVRKKFKRFNLRVNARCNNYWEYLIEDKDEEDESISFAELQEFDTNFVVFYKFEFGDEDLQGIRIQKTKFLDEILPFAAKRVDRTDASLSISSYPSAIPPQLLEIFWDDDNIKNYTLSEDSKMMPFLIHKLTTIKHIKKLTLLGYSEVNSAYTSKYSKIIFDKFEKGEIDHLQAASTDMVIDLDMAIAIIQHFKKTKGKKKFFLESKRDFKFAHLAPHVKDFGYKMKTVNRVNERTRIIREYTYKGSKLCLINEPHPGYSIRFINL